MNDWLAIALTGALSFGGAWLGVDLAWHHEYRKRRGR
jgi:hypothetical protein